MDKFKANALMVIIAKQFLYLYTYHNHLNGESLTRIVGVKQWGWGKVKVKLVYINGVWRTHIKGQFVITDCC